MTGRFLHLQRAGVSAAPRRLSLVLAAVVLALVGRPGLLQAAEPEAVCKAKKSKAVGIYALGVLKAFGRNTKTPDAAGLAQDLSRAQVNITKNFTRAEFSTYFGDLGCETTGDVGAMELKANTFVEDVLDEIPPP